MNHSDDGLFDDCPVCRMQRACNALGRSPTKDEIIQAMKVARDQGGIVGGEWMEEDEE